MKRTKIITIALIIASSIGLYLAFALKAQAPAVVENEYYEVINTWNLPTALAEVSGIAWMGDHKIACIEDEDGIIFIYDLKTKEIIRSIEFAPTGDFEAIAVNNNDAYVMRSDGTLFEVKNYLEPTKRTMRHKTVFASYNNIESLFYDQQNNRLLTMPKDKDLSNAKKKGIYSIALPGFQMDNNPSIRIDFSHPELEKEQVKRLRKSLNPSDIAIHPETGDIYILQGKRPFLFIFDPKGKFIKGLPLPIARFAQPEGICFTPEGRMFISNESTVAGPNILEMRLKDQTPESAESADVAEKE